MAERLFFPPEQVEESTYLGSIQQEGPESDFGWRFSHKHLMDEFRETARLKSEIINHPLYEHVLEAHVSCLCVGLPMDCIQAVESQLANRHSVAMKYCMLGRNEGLVLDRSKEIDEFMKNYLLLLHSFKKHLEEHFVQPMKEAMEAYMEIEQTFQAFTGVSSINLPTTSKVNKELEDDLLHGNDDFTMDIKMHSDQEDSLLEQVRDELKMELKEEYFKSIANIRKEILRKRQVGKLQGDTGILKQWWNAHFDWPYPTEEDKQKMVEATGLDLKQINNWFINHRKRNWNGRGIIDGDTLKSYPKNTSQ